MDRPAAPSAPPHAPLRFLAPGWFAMVMGLCGLSLAWGRATPLLGDLAGAAALALGTLAALVFGALALASVLRARRHPQALAEDLVHPVRHAFVATVPVSLILLATVLTGLAGPTALGDALWCLGSSLQLLVTLWVLARWPRGNQPGGLAWPGVTPVLFIPIVGNVVPPLAGVALGHTEWAAAQFGIGLLFWPVVLTLLVVRLGLHGLWPERLLPTTFITIAPPAVIGLSALQLGAPPTLAWMCWGIALFFLAWSTTLLRRLLAQPFAIPFWALSFPLAALAALTLRLASTDGGLPGLLALALLALASLVIGALALGTLRGLRQGSLLVAEPAAPASPAPIGPGAATAP